MLHVTLAFLAFSLTASAVYLLNDLLDVAHDRAHPVKSKRPIASGLLKKQTVWLTIPILLLAALGLATLVPASFGLLLILYIITTTAYSIWLKRLVIIDVMVLAGLYTLRILAGGAAADVAPSFWLLAFSIFFFFSLAMVKRHSELQNSVSTMSDKTIPGRGYRPDDRTMIASLGASAGYMSVLVLALYINEPATNALYAEPRFIWLACPLLLFWITHIWIMAQRGEVNEDPVVYAATNLVSLVVFFLIVSVFILAALWL